MALVSNSWNVTYLDRDPHKPVFSAVGFALKYYVVYINLKLKVTHLTAAVSLVKATS